MTYFVYVERTFHDVVKVEAETGAEAQDEVHHLVMNGGVELQNPHIRTEVLSADEEVEPHITYNWVHRAAT